MTTIAVVTGGAGDIGRGVVDALVKQGSKVAVLDLEINARATVSLPCDVTDEAAVTAAVSRIQDELGEPTRLVCSAGLVRRSSVVDMSLAEWSSVMDVSLTSAFLATRALLPGMRSRGDGAIVMLSSGLARKGYSFGAHYAAAKSAIEALARSVALEHAANGIRCNAVAPGPIRTAMTDANVNFDERSAISAIPMGRLGDVGEVVDPIMFLLGAESRYITGQVLQVNGGMFMG
ncbi:SDR family NAD(P)-dependent oxidoreductase [Rhodococcus sp. IEGM 1381]|uniref:SDR family NAD(P)-dependent oxidoreductase n=1 Tax=Rhodococcus sp. IEGM 1381 TaxID=3047085 RepID=UPI0024B7C525|nr:SDR family NAD(P)-dependent oxidoreductase [Rhodococcus sp. IEGM 1381]MDI9897392.1 SDR family NAD(P)-dependent oxidoreductase [Rhodococcus sp. IEGM 1381]